MRTKNIPIFVSHLGCPNDCIFCNQKKISGVCDNLEIEECKKIIDDALQYAKDTDNIEIAFFGGSFTGIEKERQIEFLKLASSYNKKIGIRLSTRPDYISYEILDLLKEYNVTTIELGVQSMVDSVLSLNERGMSVLHTINAVKLIREYEFKLGIQMMTSMYGSSADMDIYTALEVIKLKPDFVRIYPTVVITDTKLYDYYKTSEYKIKTLEETVNICTKIYTLFCNNNIPVIRLGLMASEEIKTDNVIGAYHEAFGELVMGRYYYNKIIDMIGSKIGDTLIILAPRNLMSKIIGHKKENDIKFKNIFKFILYKENDNLEVIVK